MGRNWTPSQRDAIEARGGTLLVSAAAGSGKTAVLVQRVMERLTDEQHPTDADRLLVVTFTKAAAAEMRDRIAAQFPVCWKRTHIMFAYSANRFYWRGHRSAPYTVFAANWCEKTFISSMYRRISAS